MSSLYHIVLLGSPGSGKGTLADYLEKHHHYRHCSTGDMLRHEVTQKTPLGQQVANILNAGRLVSDALMIRMIGDFIQQSAHSILFDGFPRTLKQARALKELSPIFLAIYLNVSSDTALKRVTGRLVCTHCRALYNEYFYPPKITALCDACGHTLKRREDDQNQSILERIQIFKKCHGTLLEFYQQEGLFVEINAENSPQKIIEETLSHIDNKRVQQI